MIFRLALSTPVDDAVLSVAARFPPASSCMHTAVFSIISPNYLHFARVLMDSVERHHPEWDRHVLVVGEGVGNRESGVGEERQLRPPTPDARLPHARFTTISLDALPLPNRRQFYFRYTLLELNTAVKPWMFEYLFARGYDRVIFLDPDIALYSRLIELDALPPETFLTLTPHLTGSIAGDDHPSERTILLAGIFNLGFLSVARQPALSRFLAWWQEKLEYQCVVDVERGIFVDQKWMDLTPGLFPGVAILRHEGYNVAYWNLGQRTVVGDSSSATVNGQPLRFFHFSGLSPENSTFVSRHDHALKLADVGDARKLVDHYVAALRAAGYESSRSAPYAFGAFDDGTPIPDATRIAFRHSPELQKAAGDDPFARAELFGVHRDTPRRAPLVARVGLASYRFLSRARPLVRLIPRSLRAVMRQTLLGRRDDTPRPQHHTPAVPLPGINVVGYVTRPTGVGESARLCLKACETTGLATHVIDIDQESVTQRAVHGVSLFHVNADQTPIVHQQFQHLFEASTYNIGCWHWELPELPDAWIASAAPLREIWAPSAFIQSAVSRKVTIPVVHMPHGVDVRDIEAMSPQELGAPAGAFTFLFLFDLGSVLARKNPFGAVDAFRRAFPNPSAVSLLIKVSHAAEYREQYAALEKQLRGLPGVHLSDRMLPRARVNGLLASCDAVVSLHRSEGFGLILAEAMDLGKPVVATGWSGNMDFMSTRNSCPVGYELVTLDRDEGLYAAGQQWAEPDVDHAAHFMRRLFEDSRYRTEIGERARTTIRTQFSPEVAGRRYRQRLEFLGLVARNPEP
jgi:glycosyltransferase involved in cell wall biosynthesis